MLCIPNYGIYPVCMHSRGRVIGKFSLISIKLDCSSLMVNGKHFEPMHWWPSWYSRSSIFCGFRSSFQSRILYKKQYWHHKVKFSQRGRKTTRVYQGSRILWGSLRDLRNSPSGCKVIYSINYNYKVSFYFLFFYFKGMSERYFSSITIIYIEKSTEEASPTKEII